MSDRGRFLPLGAAALALALVPLFGPPSYVMHMAVQILLWSFIYTAWSIMGRFGLVSLGHGAFLGIGMYVPALLWNLYGVTPWLGIPLGVLLAVLSALVIGWPCFRLKVVGHYFALVTLALTEVARLSIIAARDITGGSLGMTPKPVPGGHSWWALQFVDKAYFFWIGLGLWLFGLWAWRAVDRSMRNPALEAIAEDETAAAAIGIGVTRLKLEVTLISAALTALGGAAMGQYLQYLNPETHAGIGISLQIVFAAIAGGMYAMLGPTVGAVLTLVLTEALRIAFGTTLIGAANTIYGVLLILFIIFMPRGIVGLIEERLRARGAKA
ncbi:MAG: branched-chain amino acid ABC transporter permease [Alphaproteobacteria bacterium]|nr:branched-chain amino acid ABC transporter permease [Alphaproteobacteria bacterium]